MIRKAFLMKVNPDAHEEYEQRHRPIWADLQAVLKQHGVSNYSIFLEKKTHQLFAYAEIESEELWAKIAETDECRRWWAFMKDVMPTNADNSPVSVSLEEVFHLD
jgi:L-rhamnose mutarotase